MTHRSIQTILPFIITLLISSLALPSFASADDDLPTGDEIARRINARDDGTTVVRDLRMEMTDRRGKTRVRETRGYRTYLGDATEVGNGEREKRSILFYLSPANVEDTGFLTWDHPRDEDQQWLYLPALRKSRRISASDRGDAFLGTDFSYEDIKKETKVALEDYHWTTIGRETLEADGAVHEVFVVEAVPVSDEIADELGHGTVRTWVDADLWMVRKTERRDVQGEPLLRIETRDIRQVDGIWTAHRIAAENLKTGHRTLFTFSNVRYGLALDEDLFTEGALRRGPARLEPGR